MEQSVNLKKRACPVRCLEASPHLCLLAGKHVVFGNVTSGMDVVKKVESYGSSSGKTSKTITIADSGQLS